MRYPLLSYVSWTAWIHLIQACAALYFTPSTIELVFPISVLPLTRESVIWMLVKLLLYQWSLKIDATQCQLPKLFHVGYHSGMSYSLHHWYSLTYLNLLKCYLDVGWTPAVSVISKNLNLNAARTKLSQLAVDISLCFVDLYPDLDFMKLWYWIWVKRL